MVVTVDAALEWEDDHKFGRADGTIDTMALGTGTVAESESNTLSDMDIVYQTSESSEATFVERSGSITECIIDINVGQQVPLDTVLTEVACIITTPSGQILHTRDTFGGITLDQESSGRSFERYFQLETRQ